MEQRKEDIGKDRQKLSIKGREQIKAVTLKIWTKMEQGKKVLTRIGKDKQNGTKGLEQIEAHTSKIYTKMDQEKKVVAKRQTEMKKKGLGAN